MRSEKVLLTDLRTGVRLPSSPQYVTQANYTVIVINGFFVCDIPFAKWQKEQG